MASFTSPSLWPFCSADPKCTAHSACNGHESFPNHLLPPRSESHFHPLNVSNWWIHRGTITFRGAFKASECRRKPPECSQTTFFIQNYSNDKNSHNDCFYKWSWMILTAQLNTSKNRENTLIQTCCSLETLPAAVCVFVCLLYNLNLKKKKTLLTFVKRFRSSSRTSARPHWASQRVSAHCFHRPAAKRCLSSLAALTALSHLQQAAVPAEITTVH